jgi:hypothetical protein
MTWDIPTVRARVRDHLIFYTYKKIRGQAVVVRKKSAREPFFTRRLILQVTDEDLHWYQHWSLGASCTDDGSATSNGSCRGGLSSGTKG